MCTKCIRHSLYALTRYKKRTTLGKGAVQSFRRTPSACLGPKWCRRETIAGRVSWQEFCCVNKIPLPVPVSLSAKKTPVPWWNFSYLPIRLRFLTRCITSFGATCPKRTVRKKGADIRSKKLRSARAARRRKSPAADLFPTPEPAVLPWMKSILVKNVYFFPLRRRGPYH